MQILAEIAGSLVPFAVIGLVVWAIVHYVRRKPGTLEVEPGIGTVARLFIYGGALVGAFMASSGLALLVGGLVDLIGPGDIDIGEEDTLLAFGLSLVIVGAPVWVLFLRAPERSVREHPVELRSGARRAYANIVRGVALVVAVTGAAAVLQAVLRVENFDGAPWGWALVWTGLWAVHERRVRLEPAQTDETRLFDRLYLIFGSVLGIAMLAPALGVVVYGFLAGAYDAAFIDNGDSREAFGEGTRVALAVLTVAVPVWLWHWFLNARTDSGTALWRIYLFLAGILSGVVVALAGAGWMLYLTLRWVLDATDEAVAEHFEQLPEFGAMIVVGVALWAYHHIAQRVMAPTVRERSDTERVYRYLISVASLATLAGGLVLAGILAVQGLTPDADVGRQPGWWRDWVAGTLALLLVGAPLWSVYWFDLQRHAWRAPEDELSAVSRRVYIFAVTGASVVTAAVSLVLVLFQILEALLDNRLSQTDFHDVRVPLGMLLATGAIGAYHWLVLRNDRSAMREIEFSEAPIAPKLVLLVATDAAGRDLAPKLGQHGDRVTRWQRLDEPDGGVRLSEESVASLHEQIAATEADQVIVLVTPAGEAEVVPYQPA